MSEEEEFEPRVASQEEGSEEEESESVQPDLSEEAGKKKEGGWQLRKHSEGEKAQQSQSQDEPRPAINDSNSSRRNDAQSQQMQPASEPADRSAPIMDQGLIQQSELQPQSAPPSEPASVIVQGESLDKGRIEDESRAEQGEDDSKLMSKLQAEIKEGVEVVDAEQGNGQEERVVKEEAVVKQEQQVTEDQPEPAATENEAVVGGGEQKENEKEEEVKPEQADLAPKEEEKADPVEQQQAAAVLVDQQGQVGTTQEEKEKEKSQQDNKQNGDANEGKGSDERQAEVQRQELKQVKAEETHPVQQKQQTVSVLEPIPTPLPQQAKEQQQVKDNVELVAAVEPELPHGQQTEGKAAESSQVEPRQSGEEDGIGVAKAEERVDEPAETEGQKEEVGDAKQPKSSAEAKQEPAEEEGVQPEQQPVAVAAVQNQRPSQLPKEADDVKLEEPAAQPVETAQQEITETPTVTAEAAAYPQISKEEKEDVVAKEELLAKPQLQQRKEDKQLKPTQQKLEVNPTEDLVEPQQQPQISSPPPVAQQQQAPDNQQIQVGQMVDVAPVSPSPNNEGLSAQPEAVQVSAEPAEEPQPVQKQEQAMIAPQGEKVAEPVVQQESHQPDTPVEQARVGERKATEEEEGVIGRYRLNSEAVAESVADEKDKPLVEFVEFTPSSEQYETNPLPTPTATIEQSQEPTGNKEEEVVAVQQNEHKQEEVLQKAEEEREVQREEDKVEEVQVPEADESNVQAAGVAEVPKQSSNEAQPKQQKGEEDHSQQVVAIVRQEQPKSSVAQETSTKQDHPQIRSTPAVAEEPQAQSICEQQDPQPLHQSNNPSEPRPQPETHEQSNVVAAVSPEPPQPEEVNASQQPPINEQRPTQLVEKQHETPIDSLIRDQSEPQSQQSSRVGTPSRKVKNIGRITKRTLRDPKLQSAVATLEQQEGQSTPGVSISDKRKTRRKIDLSHFNSPQITSNVFSLTVGRKEPEDEHTRRMLQEIAELKQRLQYLERKRGPEHEQRGSAVSGGSQWQGDPKGSQVESRVESGANRSRLRSASKKGHGGGKLERGDSKNSSELEQGVEMGYDSAPRPRFSSARTDFFSDNKGQQSRANHNASISFRVRRGKQSLNPDQDTPLREPSSFTNKYSSERPVAMEDQCFQTHRVELDEEAPRQAEFEVEQGPERSNLPVPEPRQLEMQSDLREYAEGFKLQLAECPQREWSQEEMVRLARETFERVGVDLVGGRHRSLAVKKYKNCVCFSVDEQHTIVWYYEGKFYYGGWGVSSSGEGEKRGWGYELLPGRHFYSGGFQQNRRHGWGVIKYLTRPVDVVYQGNWSNGMRNGRGRQLEADGSQYVGEWSSGKKEGEGEMVASSGEKYKGGFKGGLKHGQGKEAFVNGDLYAGVYRRGKFEGEGTYTWANKSRYEGEFREGARNGHGQWVANCEQEGSDSYKGGYVDDKKNGLGEYRWKDGTRYEGQFLNDMKHGEGTIHYADGRSMKLNWHEGVVQHPGKAGEGASSKRGASNRRPSQRGRGGSGR